MWTKWALEIVGKRPSPDRIPLSRPRIYRRDYYSATISDLPVGNLMVRGCNRGVVSGHLWEEEEQRYSKEYVQNWKEVASGNIRITYYLRQYEFVTDSAFRFVLMDRLGAYRMVAWWQDRRLGVFARNLRDGEMLKRVPKLGATEYVLLAVIALTVVMWGRDSLPATRDEILLVVRASQETPSAREFVAAQLRADGSPSKRQVRKWFSVVRSMNTN